MKLELFESSWSNLFKVIRQSNIKSEGNFWAAVQRLERQFEERKNITKSICDIAEQKGFDVRDYIHKQRVKEDIKRLQSLNEQHYDLPIDIYEEIIKELGLDRVISTEVC